MSFALAFTIATDTAVSSVILGALVWVLAAEACGVWTLLRARYGAADHLRIEPAAVGVT